MKHNKRLLIGLMCILISVSLLLCACHTEEAEKKEEQETTLAPTEQEETPTQTEESQPEPTEEMQQTEPQETEEATEPTEPEVTEPEVTEPTAAKPGVNNGTGGGYTPGSGTTTEPAETTEAEIVPPAPGSRENAYYESVSGTTGSFETVKISAGETVCYRIKTPGAFLEMADGDVTVTYEGNTYTGTEQIPLPGDGSKAFMIQITNNGESEKAFTVAVQDVLGSRDNPVKLESLKNVTVESGKHYIWTVDEAGSLKLTLQGDSNVQGTLQLGDASYEFQNGKLELTVAQQDEVRFAFTADGEVTAVLKGYVAETVALNVTQIPETVETVSVGAGESVYCSITGAGGKTLTVAGEDITVIYEGVSYTPDESGNITLVLQRTEPALLELANGSEQNSSYFLVFGYAPGHEQNPLVLTELGEIPVQTYQDETGFYMIYTAENAGMVSFQMWIYPERDDVYANIQVINESTGESAVLISTDQNGNKLENYTAAVLANAGDKISAIVTVKDGSDAAVDAALSIYSALYGTEAQPISVNYPGFTATVPAGVTLYYEGYNLSGLPFSLTGTDVEVLHNGVTYQPNEGVIELTLMADMGTPAVFAITNKSGRNQSFEVSFKYPLGHMENPDELKRGNNTLTQVAGGEDYYFVFESPRAGKLALTFSANGNWVYAVDNVTQSVYGDTCFSDDDPQVYQTVVEVDVGDIIIVRVNTYDPDSPYETPEGTVTFKADYVR